MTSHFIIPHLLSPPCFTDAASSTQHKPDPWHSLDGGCSSQVPSGVQFLSLISLTMLVNTLLPRCSGNPDNMALSASN